MPQLSTEGYIYEYAQLRNRDTGFRLLILQPRTLKDDIECCLIEYSTDCPPSYECLSYVWGSQQQLHPVSIDGRTIMVTPSVATALRFLRYRDVPRTLWIDQLCINQNDLQERAEQVERMWKIFQGACRVIAWLGESDQHSKVAFRWMARIVGNIGRQKEVNYRRLCAAIHPQLQSLSHEEKVSMATTFQARPYWSRIWVVQEFAFAQSLVLACGKDTLGLDGLMRYLFRSPNRIQHLYKAGGASFWFFETLQKLYTLGAIRNNIQRRCYNDLDFLITVFADLHATDGRDKIYALLNLSKDRKIKPDYRLSEQKVLIRTTTRILQRAGNLKYICNNRNGSQQPGLPSWVPYLGVTELQPQFVNIYNANSFPHSPRNRARRYRIRGSHLVALGRHLGFIQLSCGPSWAKTEQKWEPRDRADILADTTNDEDLDPEMGVSQKDEYNINTLWHTMLLSRKSSRKGTPSNRFEAYRDAVIAFHTSMVQERARDGPFLQVLGTGDRMRFLSVDKSLIFTGTCALPGDEICVLYDAPVPLVLRPVEGAVGKYHYIGTAYVHGYMNGKAMREPMKFPEKKYILI